GAPHTYRTAAPATGGKPCPGAGPCRRLQVAFRWPRYRGPRRDLDRATAAGEGAKRSREGDEALAHVGSPPVVCGGADPRRGHPRRGGKLVFVPLPAFGVREGRGPAPDPAPRPRPDRGGRGGAGAPRGRG